MEVGAWVYKHFDEMSGVSFLPFSDHTYQQAPYTDITEAQYYELLSQQKYVVDWSELVEEVDNTEGAQQLACVSGVCDIM
jgi:ribonucleoside-diphosphate reductase alpha chain